MNCVICPLSDECDRLECSFAFGPGTGVEEGDEEGDEE